MYKLCKKKALVAVSICCILLVIRCYLIPTNELPVVEHHTEIRYVTVQMPHRDKGKFNEQVSCSRLLDGDPCHISRAMSSASKPQDHKEDGEFTEMTCSQLTAGYWTGPVSQSELHYPIAFTIQTHKDFYQVNKLMQAIHRQHNAYCVHVDSKAPVNFTTAFRRLASCLGNVEVAESSVVWGQSSVLLADLKCFRALHHGNRTWHYVINLTGQEYPIRTLNEMVRILKLMNGSNNMEKLSPKDKRPYPQMTNDSGLSTLQWYKGSAHAIISRDAVRYMMEDSRAKSILSHILKFYQDGLQIPDETFYATLNHNYHLLKFPGSYTGKKFTTNIEYRQIYRYKIWSTNCKSGRSVRGICILGNADLKDLNSRPELVANKFYYNFQSDAFRCVQERFWNNTLADYNNSLTKTYSVPDSFYAKLEYVKQHS